MFVGIPKVIYVDRFSKRERGSSPLLVLIVFCPVAERYDIIPCFGR